MPPGGGGMPIPGGGGGTEPGIAGGNILELGKAFGGGGGGGIAPPGLDMMSLFSILSSLIYLFKLSISKHCSSIIYYKLALS